MLITYFVLMISVLALLNSYPLTVSRDLIFDSKKTSMLNQVALISASMSSSGELTSESVSQTMEVLEVGEMDTVIVTDLQGFELYRASIKGWYAAETLIERGVSKALENKDFFYSEFNDGVFRSSASMPVISEGNIIGSVFIYERDSAQGDLLIDLQNDLKSVSILLSILAALVSIFVSTTMTSRITRLLKAVKTVREGEYTYRIDVTGKDELAQLSDEFNDLTSRLQSTEEMRQRFVGDASHELKTPLASIRLLTDSILQNSAMDKETILEFVDDIGNEAWRLTRTTEKLQMLTRIDNNVVAEKTIVDVKEIVENAVRVVRPIAIERGIVFYCDLWDGCFVEATDEGIYQIVQNLAENAVKYNVDNGAVEITLKRDLLGILLTVSDTGIGIPAEDIKHIFDRFYRVDKARSREQGGSGLGLSIVKSSAEEFGGSVRAERKAEGGTIFTVRLPLAKIREAVEE